MTLRRVASAVWNGPFWVGPLVRPVHLGDAALKVLETLWRALVAVICIVGLGAAVIAGIVYLGPVLSPPLYTKVKGSAAYDVKRCPANYPIYVVLDNRSSKTIGSFEFHIAVRLPNRSTDLNTSFEEPPIDWVTEPEYSTYRCNAVPALTQAVPDPSRLIYSVEMRDVTVYTGPYVGPTPPPIVQNPAPAPTENRTSK